jgi:trimeric autotransporter adhesin
MKKNIFTLLILSLFATSCNNFKSENENEEAEAYDNPLQRELQELNKTKDLATGKVPAGRLLAALDYTQQLKLHFNTDGVTGAWTERGPNYDSVGPSNGNGRGGPSGFTGGYTSGRIRAILVDGSDATGNTVFIGGVIGGIWKCTNFTTGAIPNWVQINDYMTNMSITSICQDPTNKDIMYAGTGEANGVQEGRGAGVFKSIDHGVTWSQLAGTTNILATFKIMCDAVGNVYHATEKFGLRRSVNGGTTWASITPNGTGTNPTCTDIEISTSGRMHASFGYGGSTVYYRYTATPATVGVANWKTSTGIRRSGTAATRLELACKGDTVYGITASNQNNLDSCYRSINGGQTFSLINTGAIDAAFNNGQSWFSVAFEVNPANANEFILGSLDLFISNDNGNSVIQKTHWVSSTPYVHADQHIAVWYQSATGESRILVGDDGGISYSNDNGDNWVDKNRNLSLKLFYSCAIHPTLPFYILGGAQDNGVHQLKKAGLSYSTEVTGGDGCYVAIDQNNPQYQFGSYVFNSYKRSTNGGATWSAVVLDANNGSFVNPFEYDNTQKIMLCTYLGNNFLRWNNPQTSNSQTIIPLSELGGPASAFAISPYTTGRAFIGSEAGSIVKLENTKTTTGTGSADVTALTQPAGGNLNCIAIGTNDNNLLAIYSNYGMNNVWYSADGGTNWDAIDGNLPDMPVRWAVFHPTLNTAAVIATEAGVFSTTLINGVNTVWTPSPGFPLVRVDMLKLRKSDNTLVAATHGRGMWTANILNILPLKKVTLAGVINSENFVNLNWSSIGATSATTFILQTSTDGVNFTQIQKTNNLTSNFSTKLIANNQYFRMMAFDANSNPIYSNTILLAAKKKINEIQISIAPNPIVNNSKITISSGYSGAFTWQVCNIQGNVLQTGTGVLESNINMPILANTTYLKTGVYLLKVIQNNSSKTARFIKQ